MSPTYINRWVEGIEELYRAEYRQNFRGDSVLRETTLLKAGLTSLSSLYLSDDGGVVCVIVYVHVYVRVYCHNGQ